MKQTAIEWLFEQVVNTDWKNSTGEEKIKIFEQAKEMEKEQIKNTSKVTRVEVIQHSPPYNGRAYTNHNAKDVEIEFQDDDRTLKIFLR